MRGDPPELIPSKGRYYMSTPHARGSTALEEYGVWDAIVYPACAGIHLRLKQ